MSKLTEKMRAHQRHGFDRAVCRKTDVLPYADQECKPNGMGNLTIDRSTGYTLTAMIGVNFWANQAQYDSARRQAEKMVVQTFYAEVFQAIDELHALLYAYDTEAAHVRLDKLRSELED